MFKYLSLLCAIQAHFSAASYNWALGNTSVWLSSAAYCAPSSYLTKTYGGYSAGFVATNHIQVTKDTTEGFVGYMSSQNKIYVSFRGSETIQNWVDNLDAVLTGYSSCSGCEVHKGFYSAEQAAFSQVLSAVQALKQRFPSYGVIVTGHSLGAALATLTALDLQSAGVSDVHVMHFGSPRVGNTEFANWANTKFGKESTRNTHHKDMVVHTPMHERFTHHAGEYYEDPTNVLTECSGNEDPKCSYQWHITSIDDHMTYLGKAMGQDGCV